MTSDIDSVYQRHILVSGLFVVSVTYLCWNYSKFPGNKQFLQSSVVLGCAEKTSSNAACFMSLATIIFLLQERHCLGEYYFCAFTSLPYHKIIIYMLVCDLYVRDEIAGSEGDACLDGFYRSRRTGC